MKPAPEIIEMDIERLESLLHRAEQASLSPEDRQTIRTICESYLYLTQLIDQKSTTIARLRKFLFGAQTEKTSTVLSRGSEDSLKGQAGESASGQTCEEPASGEPTAAKPSASSRQPGHGRNGASDSPGAQRVSVSHPSLQAGDACPECPQGTLYTHPAGVLLRFTARPPVQATVYELQKLRCHLCGKVYTAEPPASTQWEIVSGAVEQFAPVHQELIRQAADGEVVYNDDTTVKILELMDAHPLQRGDLFSNVQSHVFLLVSGYSETVNRCGH